MAKVKADVDRQRAEVAAIDAREDFVAKLDAAVAARARAEPVIHERNLHRSSPRLYREARRRKVFRTAALYVVGAWLALQVAA